MRIKEEAHSSKERSNKDGMRLKREGEKEIICRVKDGTMR